MIKIAVIGLDTSHSVSYPALMQGPKRIISGMKVETCFPFLTPFTTKKTLAERSEKLAALGVKVTENWDEALDGCDAVMLEINDGSFHLEYFKKVAALGKPVFLDKPLAATLADGRAIMRLARKHQTRVWSSSSIPFTAEFEKVPKEVPEVRLAHMFGPLGIAPAGDSLIWYGVHVVESIQRLMGPGALNVRAIETPYSIAGIISYADDRQALMETVKKTGYYGGRAQGFLSGGEQKIYSFVCDNSKPKKNFMQAIKSFFQGGPAPVSMASTFEGLAIMAAARKSIETGRTERVASIPTYAS